MAMGPCGPLVIDTIRVLALGVRRGPAAEARLMYDEIAWTRLSEFQPVWEPLLVIEDW
jgi:hypothetical protein